MTNLQSAIDRDGSIRIYLDKRKSLHNGLGYDDLIMDLTEGLNASDIALKFGVQRQTVTQWIEKSGWVKVKGGKYPVYEERK